MKLMHFSDKPVIDIYPVDQTHTRPGDFSPKPKGLWVSDEDEYGWSKWCVDEHFGENHFTYHHEVTLFDDANILMITNEDEIDSFTNKYGASIDPNDFRHYYWIDWPSVAEKYQGVLITPYIYSRRLASHTSWYYVWDCASGCIWNPDAVSSISVSFVEE